jgi:hypothetical protein
MELQTGRMMSKKANRCWENDFEAGRGIKSRAVARNTKVRTYKTTIKPVVTYVREVFEHGRGKC